MIAELVNTIKLTNAKVAVRQRIVRGSTAMKGSAITLEMDNDEAIKFALTILMDMVPASELRPYHEKFKALVKGST